MALLHAQELATEAPQAPAAVAASARRQPRFAVFATTSTHAPFHPLAPFTPDWLRLTGPDAYSPAQVQAAQAVTLTASVRQALPLYLDAMRCQFAWLADYIGRITPPGLLIVVVGDHQPPALVSGPSESWDVPVHVFSTEPALLRRLQGLGFAEGLQLPAARLGSMDQLTTLLLQAFDGSTPGP